jgi:thiosulfate/3-mercaptopyruvate sulfurtransferase
MGTALSSVRLVGTAAAAQGTPDASTAAGNGYARPEMLIDAASLMARIDDPSLKIFAFMPSEQFTQGHIPGSVQIDPDARELPDASEVGIARWQAETAELLGSLGVTGDTTVVTYDGGTLRATFPWWFLQLVGHEDASVLNGGLTAWTSAGGKITAEASPSTPVTAAAPGPYQGTLHPEVLAGLDDVLASLDMSHIALLDTRTPEEYAEGHIPGAANVDYTLNAVAAEPQLWRPQDELRAMYEAAGITPDKQVIPYCRTGSRASVTYFTLRLIGYDNVVLYPGSWKEWSEHPGAPVAVGSKP